MESPRFSFPIPDSVADDLTACYQHVVRLSGLAMQLTSDTSRVLASAAGWLESGKHGLLLMGKCGTGKSKLVSAIALLVDYYSKQRVSLKVFPASQIVSMALSKDDEDAVTFSRLKTYHYLAVDDLGVEATMVKSWGTELSPVLDMLYARYDKRMVTILSTNFDMAKLKEVYGERIVDRINEQYDRISFDFKSFRG